MQSTESKNDFKLELAFALAMIISLVGCGMPSHINISGPAFAPADSVVQSSTAVGLKVRLPRRIRLRVVLQLVY
jgi:hypothetical protein